MYRPRRIINSFSGTLAAVILALLIISMLLLSTYWYLGERSKVDRDFLDRQNMTSEMLQQSIIWIDRGVILYELTYEPDLKNAMTLYQSAYNETNGDINALNLSDLKRQFFEHYSGEWDLYLIDTGVVKQTTFHDDINLDFKKYPSLYHTYANYTRTGELVIDRAVKGFAQGAPIRKFAYQGSPDHRYLLEISRNFKKFRPEENKASYRELINTTVNLNPYIQSIELYNSQNDIIANSSATPQIIPHGSEVIGQVKKTFSSRKNFVEENQSQDLITVYSFLPVEDTGAPSTPMMHLVARTVYSVEHQNKQFLQLTLIYLCFIIITTLIAFLIAIAISRHLTKPLTQIGEDVDHIASGDLNHQITKTGSVETERIEHSISQMVANLKENIETLRLREEELNQELIMRKKAEERYWRLFDSSHEAIFILEKWIVRDCNQEACSLLRRQRDEIIGKKISEYSPDLEQSYPVVSDPSGTYSTEWAFIRADGALIETEVHLNTISLGESVILQVMVRDVTELNEMYRREIRAIEQIEKNLGQLAAINDQIRNPLAIISSLSDIIGGEYEPEIQDQIKRIDDLVNEIDRGFVNTDKVRMYLHKHYELAE